jgi:hypothetical protein
MCRQAGSNPTISSSRSSKRSDYAEMPHGGWPGNKVLVDAMRHNPGYGIMAKLMQRGAVPVHRLVERRLWRHLHKVVARAVEGFAAADIEARAARRDQRIGLGDCEHRIGSDHRRDIILGQSLTLVDIEHDEALQERHLPRLAILAACGFGFGLRGEPVGIADDSALLAAPDIAARRLGLPVGQPALRHIAFSDNLGPQDQHIDPAIFAGRSGILRHRASARRAVPRLHPWQPPGFQFRDDPVRDLGIEARPLGPFLAHILSPSRQPHPGPEGGGGGRQEGAGRPA